MNYDFEPYNLSDIFLSSLTTFAYPGCSSILPIKEYNQLDENEKLYKTHPYLLLSYCQPNESKKYIDLFKQSTHVNELLNEISIEMRRSNCSKDSKQFFKVLKDVSAKNGTRYPDLNNDLRFINLNFAYLCSQSNFDNACDYLIVNAFL